jgi:hypothetical protein
MKKFAAFGILLSLASATSTAMASPDKVRHQSTTYTDSGQKQVVIQQGHIAKEEKAQAAPASLDHSTLADPRLDGNIGTTGATAATGAVSAPGI